MTMRTLKQIEENMSSARDKLRRGTYGDVEGAYLVCVLFYYDMVRLLNSRAIENHQVVSLVLENIRTSSDVMAEYISLNADDKTKSGHLIAFGMIQCLTQIVDASELIYRLVGLDEIKRFKSIKTSEYWKFRNRVTHTHTRKSNQSMNDPEGLDTHIFISEKTNADMFYYFTIGERIGHMGRPALITKIFSQVGWELRQVFEEVYKHCAADAGAAG